MTKKVAIITGGTGGIGLVTAHKFVEEDIQVVLADLDEEKGRREAGRLGAGACFEQADLSAREPCRRLIDATLDRFGKVDILINNAGFQHMDAIENFPEDKWDEMLMVMLTAPFLLTKYAWPSMKKSGWGRIVNISSIQGLVASPFKAAYVSAKTGLLGLTRTTALEGGAHGITANALCPAYVDTPLISGQLADQAALHGIPLEEVPEKIFLQSAAIKRMVQPEEVADLIYYLCSEKAGAITGASWTIDLGFTAQ